MKSILGFVEGLGGEFGGLAWVRDFGGLSSGERAVVVEVWWWLDGDGWMMGGDGWWWLADLVAVTRVG